LKTRVMCSSLWDCENLTQSLAMSRISQVDWSRISDGARVFTDTVEARTFGNVKEAARFISELKPRTFVSSEMKQYGTEDMRRHNIPPEIRYVVRFRSHNRRSQRATREEKLQRARRV